MNAFTFLFLLLGLAPMAEDLSVTGTAATNTGCPILLYVSRSDCTFCRRFEKEQLGPLMRSGEYNNKLIIRELIWDDTTPIVNFHGETTTRKALAKFYEATLTPTLLFLDGTGEEIRPRITGYRSNDYFGFYFEAAIIDAFTITQNRL